jgi:hypothetical protein
MKICPECGKTFEPRTYHRGRAHTVTSFCSRNCAARHNGRKGGRPDGLVGPPTTPQAINPEAPPPPARYRVTMDHLV